MNETGQRTQLCIVALVMTTTFFGCVGGIDEDGGPDAPDAGRDLTWFRTCGDPVCNTFVAPTDVDACTTESAGETCTTEDESCYLDGDDCNVRLLCTDEDPTQQPGGCPISKREAKDHIVPVSVDDERALARTLLDTPLATWRYRGTEAERLGFIIGEGAPPFAVRPNGGQVDVYGYTSLAVATLKHQQRTIERLEARLSALERTCAASTRPTEAAPPAPHPSTTPAAAGPNSAGLSK